MLLSFVQMPGYFDKILIIIRFEFISNISVLFFLFKLNKYLKFGSFYFEILDLIFYFLLLSL